MRDSIWLCRFSFDKTKDAEDCLAPNFEVNGKCKIDDSKLCDCEEYVPAAKNEELEKALSRAFRLWRKPTEGYVEYVERISDWFFEECHMLMPGRSQADALNGIPSEETRKETYEKWYWDIYLAMENALILSPAKSKKEEKSANDL